ncbi:MAG TPA: helix-turn-helix domain-containing protein [Candidatus Krumholzibacteria bacterium]|nr:helix-turn-helix domain-containing protein [Candidatus Krumholzibacteria bacterium]
MRSIPSLEALGLTRLETLAYVFLVANPGATGYRVSKGTGKPTANVYRALESLERKGAVTRDRASPPLYRAVPPAELLDRLEVEFMDRREIAARALSAIEPGADPDDDGIYVLKRVEQVTGRARILLSAARRIALLEATPGLIATVDDAIDDARARGVRVLVLSRGSGAGNHADTLIGDVASGGLLRMTVDGREAIIAALSAAGEVREAWWTRSAVVAATLHDAVANAGFFLQVERGLREGLSVDDVEAAFERCRELRTTGMD